MTDALVSLADLHAARARIGGRTLRTPLVDLVGSGLSLKAESLQPTGAFKLRGALSALLALDADELRRGVVADSSGNHAQAVAYAARLVGTTAVIVMPPAAPAIKLAATRGHGADVRLVDGTRADQARTAREIAEAEGRVLVPPFEHRHVIAGQGTAGLEIAEDAPETDLVLVPVSGGGLLSGIAVAMRALLPGARVVGVEPSVADDAQRTFRSGEIVTLEPGAAQRTLADGLRVDRLGDLTWQHIRALVDDIVTVDEDEILAAMGEIGRSARLVAEPSGAVAAAAWLSRRHQLPAASRPVAIVSGGNVDPALLARVIGG